jgi:uncharacterized membrane protein HdeD (DUF308 family)
VRSLALLVTVGLIVAGLLEIASSPYGHRWVGLLLGALLIVGGLVTVFWPGLAVWPLAVIVGINLTVHGFLRAVVCVVNRAELRHWGWLAFVGALEVAIGVAALVWPAATVLVLAALLGVQILIFGVVAMVVGFRPAPTA